MNSDVLCCNGRRQSGVALRHRRADSTPRSKDKNMDDAQQRIRSAISAFARGELVIVADDDDRESEGDLFVAASLCTPEKMAFVIRHTSGIVCAPLTPEETRRLHLNSMVPLKAAPLGTAFTVSVDGRHGLTTGISAEERTNTVRALANGNSGAADFARPGHVFPLVAKEGRVDALGAINLKTAKPLNPAFTMILTGRTLRRVLLKRFAAQK